MAKISWLDVTPISGSGNASVTVKSDQVHTGREQRQMQLTFSASNVSDEKVTVKQNGKPEFVTMESTKSVAKDATQFTITGTSNSKKLTFSLGSGGTLSLTLPANYTAASVSTVNGADIQDDPGASEEYAFSITFDCSVNSTINDLTKQVIVTANNSATTNCTVTQTAGDATLSVNPSTITLDWNDSGKAISVTSNTSWAVS